IKKYGAWIGSVAALVMAIEVLMPYFSKTVTVTNNILTAPEQSKLTDSLVRDYAKQFTAEMQAIKVKQDSTIQLVLENRKGSHMHQVGLRADTNNVLYYRDRFNELHRIFHDTSGALYYVDPQLNKYKPFNYYRKRRIQF
ncbi:MAG: hypothetical protein ACPG5O_04140, partial [Pseudoalteromonas tetraodonis]